LGCGKEGAGVGRTAAGTLVLWREMRRLSGRGDLTDAAEAAIASRRARELRVQARKRGAVHQHRPTRGLRQSE
jgi:hypothetical protein